VILRKTFWCSWGSCKTIVLFKQVLANLQEEKGLTGEIIKIINELLITLVYKVPPTVTERGVAIFVGTLIQKTNRFERALSFREVAELISVYTIILKEDDFQELKGILKFIKASKWSSATTPGLSNKQSGSKTPDSRTSPWNTFNIPKTTSGINAIGLNKEENP